MKLKVTTLLITVFFVSQLSGQEVTMVGTGVQSIFSIDSDETDFKTYNDFNPYQGSSPTDLIEYDGNYWGVTSSGGQHDQGTIFKMNIDGSDFEIVHNFISEIGSFPRKILNVNGVFYGTASSGGLYERGAIYSFDPTSESFDVLYDFQDIDGSFPSGKFTLVDDKLWGATVSGGLYGLGSIYFYDLNSSSFLKVFDFEYTNGRQPNANMVYYNSKLWGVTQDGGANYDGVIFSLNPFDYTYNVEYEFESSTGSVPMHGLIVNNGLLWGVTNRGGIHNGGVIFSFDPMNSQYNSEYDFYSTTGTNPSEGLIVLDEVMYGVTQSNGDNEVGTIYSFDLNSGSFSVISNNDRPKSGNNARTILAESPDLILVQQYGGINNNGLIYSLNLNNSEGDILHDFSLESPISTLYGGLVESNFRMWGVSTYGGEYGYGSLFSMDIDGTNLKIEHSFNKSDGSIALGNTLTKVDDQLWGMTAEGGDSNNGVIFYFDTKTLQYKKIHDFDGSNGRRPYGQLLLHNEELWGMTVYGGLDDYGCIFKIKTSGKDFEKVFNFTDTNGRLPFGNSLSIHDDRIWGTARSGGENGSGVLFNFSEEGNDFQVVHNFDFFTTGGNPRGKLIEFDEKLWGLTSSGGETSGGVVYSYDLSDNTYEVVYDFNNLDDGGSPYGGLTSYNDKLWGFTSSGGINGRGVIFTIDPDNNSYSKVKDLTNSTSQPLYQSPLIIKNRQEITFDSIEGEFTQNSNSITLSATSSSNLPVTFGSSDETIGTIDGSKVLINNYGELTLTAYQVGNEVYYPADSVSQTINIERVLNTINDTNNIIYPTPTKDYFRLKGVEADEALILIYNTNGKIVKQVEKIAGEYVDVKNLNPGVYLVVLKNSYGKNFLGRLIKN